MESYNKKDIRRGMLYDKDSQFVASVDYIDTGEKLFIYIVDQIVDRIPQEAFLVLPTRVLDNIVFLISLKYVGLDRKRDNTPLWIGYRLNAHKNVNTRGDLRVPVAIHILLHNPALETPVQALIKNISARGILFLAEASFTKGMDVAFELPIDKHNVPLIAEIVNKIPTTNKNIWGYGCRFISLDASMESKIRQFVFQEDCRHKMKLRMNQKTK